MRMLSVAPTFVVSNVDATVEWYVKELGFHAFPFPQSPPYVFAILQRDAVEIMLMKIEGYQKPDLTPLRPAGLWDAYFRIDNVVGFYQSFRDKPYLWRPLKTQPYGDTEFELRDPNGYILAFSGVVEEA